MTVDILLFEIVFMNKQNKKKSVDYLLKLV